LSRNGVRLYNVHALSWLASVGWIIPRSGATRCPGSSHTTSLAGSLGILVTAIRVNVTAYTSGTLTFQFIQGNP
jgi:hypothetical protein